MNKKQSIILDKSIRKADKVLQQHFKRSDQLIKKIHDLKIKKYYNFYEDSPIDYLKMTLSCLYAVHAGISSNNNSLQSDTSFRIEAIIKLLSTLQNRSNVTRENLN